MMDSLNFFRLPSNHFTASVFKDLRRGGKEASACLREIGAILTLRVQVLNNQILTQNLHYNYYYPNPKYLIIGYLDPLGEHASRMPYLDTRMFMRLNKNLYPKP